jgi:hypothetical protein
MTETRWDLKLLVDQCGSSEGASSVLMPLLESHILNDFAPLKRSKSDESDCLLVQI